MSRAECQNCGKVWPIRALKPIRHYSQRVEPGEEEPDGECPECGALAHELPWYLSPCGRTEFQLTESQAKAWGISK